MKKLFLAIGTSAVLATLTAGPALAAPPTEPPNDNAAHACVYHGAPGTIGLPRAPFCPQ